MDLKDTIISSAETCPRCGSQHSELTFKPLSGLSVVNTDGYYLTHWSTCPDTGEPILLQMPGTPVDKSRPYGVRVKPGPSEPV